jgi:hypothetical protein
VHSHECPHRLRQRLRGTHQAYQRERQDQGVNPTFSPVRARQGPSLSRE